MLYYILHHATLCLDLLLTARRSARCTPRFLAIKAGQQHRTLLGIPNNYILRSAMTVFPMGSVPIYALAGTHRNRHCLSVPTLLNCSTKRDASRQRGISPHARLVLCFPAAQPLRHAAAWNLWYNAARSRCRLGKSALQHGGHVTRRIHHLRPLPPLSRYAARTSVWPFGHFLWPAVNVYCAGARSPTLPIIRRGAALKNFIRASTLSPSPPLPLPFCCLALAAFRFSSTHGLLPR